MKYKVVLNKEGNIVSIEFNHRTELDSFDYLVPRSGPKLEPGQRLVELDEAKEFAEFHPADLAMRLHSDAKAKLQEMK
jgi:hypothetical protein